MKALFLLLMISIFSLNCNNIGDKNNSHINDKTHSPQESFEKFYEKFHNDSGFQLSRIRFPLPGFSIEKNSPAKMQNNILQEHGDSLIVNNYWNREDWILNQMPIDNDTFDIKIEKNDSIVTETVFIPDSDFEVLRIFKSQSGNWFLSYYYENY